MPRKGIPKPKRRNLSARREAFKKEIVKDFNAKQAAIRAGYSPATAHSTGSLLLKNPNVQEAIGEARRVAEEKSGITKARVLQELSALAFSNVSHYAMNEKGDLIPAADAPPDVMRAVSSIKRKTLTLPDGSQVHQVEFRLWDKPGTLKLAGRHVGAKGFYDRVELTDGDGRPVTVVTLALTKPEGAKDEAPTE